MLRSQLAGRNLAEDDSKREYVGREVEFVAEEDFRGHVRVSTTECEALALFLVPRCDASETEVSYLQTAVRGDKKILALQVAMYAFPGVKVGEGASDVGREG